MTWHAVYYLVSVNWYKCSRSVIWFVSKPPVQYKAGGWEEIWLLTFLIHFNWLVIGLFIYLVCVCVVRPSEKFVRLTDRILQLLKVIVLEIWQACYKGMLVRINMIGRSSVSSDDVTQWQRRWARFNVSAKHPCKSWCVCVCSCVALFFDGHSEHVSERQDDMQQRSMAGFEPESLWYGNMD